MLSCRRPLCRGRTRAHRSGPRHGRIDYPGDDPGFPVTISQSGSYRLTSNLTVTDLNTTAIRITTNSVTLDLNGFSIFGPVVCAKNPTICPTPGTGTGIQSAEPGLTRGVRIFNGTVRGM